jgi:HEPN domain-containing protein
MLAKYKTAQLQQIVDIIVHVMKPEKIFFLGASMVCNNAENVFRKNILSSCTIKEYQLLVVLPDTEKRDADEVQDIIENNCRSHTPVTSIVIPLHIFNQWMVKGHLLAHTVYHADCLIHDKGTAALASPGEYKVGELQRKVRKEFEDWAGRAVEFLAGAETFRTREQYNIAAFLLHQAAELAYMAIVRLVTGFRAGTHNLDKLSRYAVPFCGTATHVFPRHNDKERRLFKLIQKAYIHGRYKDDFIITEKELEILMERVAQLLVAVQEIGRQKPP